MQHDEARHGANALSLGGARLPSAVSTVMRLTSKVMTLSSYWI
jgi:demethoxyubiquinone hydroxylase (CLK1/Coq7/Cat5 family)